MTRATLFEDAFWEQDITSTRGFDILVRRLKEGRKICKEVEDYFKERAKAEQTYAKAITNISRRLDCKEELGDLGQALRKLKTETEQIAKAHDEAYQDFSKLQKELAHFSENQKQQKQEGTGELTVNAGNKVEIIRPMQGNMIQIKLQGRCGLIPVYCITQGQATYL
ncbi:hypothetical protein FSP39_017251 [Pinctada imbricata]|uniref:F-BAR domain-containing protein n=1 Tax=Pinctada imbricata TaxID=66713 RepID=A0AA88XDG7_PINIB|nr:hypothetical protein FSP39_017251 [Pinctada imbricata]